MSFSLIFLILVTKAPPLTPGLLVNGPYALITTSVSAELGTHRSLVSSARALATVTAIIDGTGSIGNYQSAVITHHCQSHKSSLLGF